MHEAKAIAADQNSPVRLDSASLPPNGSQEPELLASCGPSGNKAHGTAGTRAIALTHSMHECLAETANRVKQILKYLFSSSSPIAVVFREDPPIVFLKDAITNHLVVTLDVVERSKRFCKAFRNLLRALATFGGSAVLVDKFEPRARSIVSRSRHIAQDPF